MFRPDTRPLAAVSMTIIMPLQDFTTSMAEINFPNLTASGYGAADSHEIFWQLVLLR